ncbi:hypothetical protein FGADI_10790 [Fusarium gaditjirri]|uniref:NmrA-like domain-containing protein n=1 Tax=Fusarium gaditjirri TaxID=282569 RepID=A0A8H4WRA5_9HYPO|nr:hypothetical protein FGADI_10790 [Fusarium gaditjirri]
MYLFLAFQLSSRIHEDALAHYRVRKDSRSYPACLSYAGFVYGLNLSFGQLKGYRVRGMTRDTESPGAISCREKNPEVEIVQASLEDAESLYQAFRGASATLTPTYYWIIIAVSREAAGRITLERIVFSALPDPQNYPLAYHFASRASYLYIGVYLDSFFSKSYLTVGGRHLIGPQKQVDGSFLFRRVARPPYHALPMIYAKTDLDTLVEALIGRAPPGTHLLDGQPLTREEFAMKWGNALGVRVKWEGTGVEEMVSEFPESARSFVRTDSHSAAFVTEHEFDGGLGAKWPSELGVQSGELIDVEQWVKEGVMLKNLAAIYFLCAEVL